MIGAIHEDGRIVLMASEHGISPVIKYPDGTWGPAIISGQELDEFEQLSDAAIAKVLEEALRLAVVHYVGYASQPYVQILCTGVHSYVHVKPENLPEGVYRSDDGLYTFDVKKASCTKCLDTKEQFEELLLIKYKPCNSCKGLRDEGNWEMAIRCSSCKGKGAVRNHESYQCNYCGGSMAPTEDSEDKSPHGLVETRVGGGSNSFHLSDCTSYTFSLCERCLRDLFEVFKIPPQVDSSIGEDPSSYEEDSKYYGHRLWIGEGGCLEAYLNGLCTESMDCGQPARWVTLDEKLRSFTPGVRQESRCDGHVWGSLFRTFSKTVPIEKVPLRTATPEQLKTLREAVDNAPSQNMFQNGLSGEDLLQMCKEALGDKWDWWSTNVHLDGCSPSDLLERDPVHNAYFLNVLIQVFAQRGEIPYQNE